MNRDVVVFCLNTHNPENVLYLTTCAGFTIYYYFKTSALLQLGLLRRLLSASRSSLAKPVSVPRQLLF